MKWGVATYDTFEGEWYGGGLSYDTEAEAETAAQQRANKLELSQPTASSGGAGLFGIQDKVYIVNEAGIVRQVMPSRPL